MPHEVETMSWYGARPWHGLGVELTDNPTADRLYQAAELDWAVELVGLLTENADPVPDFFAVQRDRDHRILGVVGDRYEVVQNTQLLEVAQALEAAGIHWRVAGSLREGQRVWFCGQLPDQQVAGDLTEAWLTLMNDHSGRMAVMAVLSPVRVVCMNTLTAALGAAESRWTVRHTLSAGDRLGWAEKQIERSLGLLQHLDTAAQALIDAPFSVSQHQQLVNALVPALESETQTRRQLRDALMAAIHQPDLAPFAGTKWASFQAVTYVTSHQEDLVPARRGTRTQHAERRFRRFLGDDPLARQAWTLLQTP